MSKLFTFLSILLLMLVISIYPTSGAIDKSMVGVEEGDKFVYNFIDTFPSDSTTVPRSFFVENSEGEQVYIRNNQELTLTIDTAPSEDERVVFELETSDGDIRFRDHSDIYGQPVVFNDWDHWSSEVTEDTKIIDPGVDSNENVTIINNSTHFGSIHNYAVNSSGSTFWFYSEINMHFVYGKDTGVLHQFYFNVYTEDDSGSTDNPEYGFNLIDQELGNGGGISLNTIIILAIVVIVGIVIYRRKRSSSSTPDNQSNMPIQTYSAQQNQTQSYYENQGQDHSMSRPSFCTSCGQKLGMKENFCTNCGTRI